MICDSLITVILSTQLNVAADYAPLYQGRVEQMLSTTQWKAEPYWPDKEFRFGDVSYDGIVYPHVKLRYDAYTQNLVVVAPKREIALIPDQDRVDYFILDGWKYVRMNDSYYRLDGQGDEYSIYHNLQKKRSRDISDGRFVYHSLKDVEEYFIITSDSVMVPVKRIKQIPKAIQNLEALRKKKGIPVRPRDNQEVVADQPRPIPSSLFDEVEIKTDLPSYLSFREGAQPEYDPLEETYTADAVGVSDLEPIREPHTLREVEVIGFAQKLTAAQTGVEAFRPALLKNIPLAMGEADVMKMATLLPGIKTMGEASSGLNVRGGGSDQNLMLYNGNTIFNPMHMFGLFSTFNSDMIAETEIFKGGISSQYGGRLSSVVNIKGKYADKQQWHGSATVGLITSKAVLEAPIIKDKVSLLIGGRTTYSDWMLKKIPEDSGYKNGKAGFWDLGATLSANLGLGHSLIVSGYYSSDRFSFTEYDRYAYSNRNISAEWRGHYGDRWSSSVAAGYDYYKYSKDDTGYIYASSRLGFSLGQYWLKGKASYKLNDAHRLSFGMNGNLYSVNPGSYVPLDEMSYVVESYLPRINAIETALFAEDEYDVNEKLKLTGGVRLNFFHNPAEGKQKTYASPDLRLAASYAISDISSVKMGFNNLCQYIHKVSNTAIMSPTDTWTLSNSRIKPQQGWQVSAGYFLQSKDGTYEFSVEGYYKSIRNYLTYGSGAQLIMNPNLEDDVISTQGRAFGVEIQLRKSYGKLTGWLNYTFSRSLLRHRDPEANALINGGEWFAAEHDSPHSVKFVGNYKFTRRFSLSLNADYSTGRPTTIPAGQFYDSSHGGYVPYYTKRNSYRIPDYFRMDGSLNFEPTHHLTALVHHMLSLGVYNMLGRRNVYSVYYKIFDGTRPQGYSLTIFGAPIPYVSYSLKF